jgi:hypothetical protein
MLYAVQNNNRGFYFYRRQLYLTTVPHSQFYKMLLHSLLMLLVRCMI